MPFGGLLIAGVGLAAGAVESGIQSHKANEIQKGLQDPHFNIPPEFFQNREIARQMAQVGIPTQQYNNAQNNINQNEAASIAAAQNSNNPAGAISNITRQSNQAKARLDAEDAQARDTNQRYFINENSQVGAQKLQQQQSDVFDKFTRDFNQMQAYRGAAQQNLNNVIGGAQNLGLTYMNAQNNNSTTTQPTQATIPQGTAQQLQMPAYMWQDQPIPNQFENNGYTPNPHY